jgi:hypothetical protein
MRTAAKARVLWIDADPVFGGSRSQVQFPVELSSFFSLPIDPAIGTYVTKAVICAGILFDSKKMDFHHNDVWRLNLPTARQGLGGYRGNVLVFERTDRPDVYRLWAIERATPIFRRLRKTSRTHGRLNFKRRDDGGRREYGFF